MPQEFPISFQVADYDAGKRLDQFLVSRLDGVSRARVQELIAAEKVLVDDAAAKASLKLRGGESISVLGHAERPPLRAMAEDIPLDIRYEDNDLAIINKPAGMMVHAGAGPTESDHNRGTLVNALLHHFASLSGIGGELRPGIVHRLDKETSGLIVVAKNDEAHRKLSAQFAAHTGQACKMMQQGIHQSSAIVIALGGARAGVDHHSRGLVDHGEIVVFIDNVEGNVFGDGLQRRALGLAKDGDRFVAMELEGGLGWCIVHQDFAFGDHFLHASAADGFKPHGHELIQALAGIFRRYRDKNRE